MGGQGMTDYSELVKALRERARRENEWYEHGGDIINDAAAAIVALQAEIRESMQKCAECGENEPKRGEWKKAKPKGVVTYSDGYAECSHCHETIWLGWGMNFCPHCGTQNKIIDPDDYDGAKMTDVQDG